MKWPPKNLFNVVFLIVIVVEASGPNIYMGISLLILLIFLLRGHEWARKVILFYSGLELFLVFGNENSESIYTFVAFAVHLFTLIALNSKNIKKHFLPEALPLPELQKIKVFERRN